MTKIIVLNAVEYEKLTGKKKKKGDLVQHSEKEAEKLIEKGAAELQPLERELLAEQDKKNRGVGETTQGIDILLNPIVKHDRFGCTFKNGRLYYGVVVANKRGEMVSAIVSSGRKFIFGRDNLEAEGLNFGSFTELPTLSFEWDNKLIYRWLEKQETAESTPDLFKQLVELNKRFIFHQDDNAHSIVAAFVLAQAIYSVFKQFGRFCLFGEPDSGKSTQSDLIAALGLNTIVSGDASKASIFRDVEASAGLFVVDNFDTQSEEKQGEYVEIYDTSFERGREIRRVEGDGSKRKTVRYRTYCPMVVNCVSREWMPRSSITRTIFLRMLTRGKKKLEKFDKDAAFLSESRHKVRLWALENAAEAETIAKKLTLNDELKDKFQTRSWDISLPLLTVAKMAGDKELDIVRDYLLANFKEYHRENEFSDNAHLYTALWNYVSRQKEDVVKVPVKEIAEAVLALKGVRETDKEDRPTKSYESRVLSTCHWIAGKLYNTNYEATSRPGNRLHFHYNQGRLKEYLKTRGHFIEEQDKL